MYTRENKNTINLCTFRITNNLVFDINNINNSLCIMCYIRDNMRILKYYNISDFSERIFQLVYWLVCNSPKMLVSNNNYDLDLRSVRMKLLFRNFKQFKLRFAIILCYNAYLSRKRSKCYRVQRVKYETYNIIIYVYK